MGILNPCWYIYRDYDEVRRRYEEGEVMGEDEERRIVKCKLKAEMEEEYIRY